MDTKDLYKGPIVLPPNCSSCKPESLPKMRRRCKSESLDTSPISKRTPFLNVEKFAVFNPNTEMPNYYQRSENENDIYNRSPKKYLKPDVCRCDRPDPAMVASEMYYNKNFLYRDKAKSLSPYKSQNGVHHNIASYEPRVMNISYERHNYSVNNSPKSHALEKQSFNNYHPKLFQESPPSKLDARRKEETYRQFCNDVDALRGKLNHFKNVDAQNRSIECYIKRSIIQATKYKEHHDKSVETVNCHSNNKHQVLKQNDHIPNSPIIRSSIINDKDPYSNMYGNNRSPVKSNTDRAYNFQTLSPYKGNLLNSKPMEETTCHRSGLRRRIRARSESDTISHTSTDRYGLNHSNLMLTKRARDESPGRIHHRVHSSASNSPRKDVIQRVDMSCNNVADGILRDSREENKNRQKSKTDNDTKQKDMVEEKTTQHVKIRKISKKKSKPVPVTNTVPVSDDEQECVMESCDGSDSEDASSDTDNNEISFTLDSCEQPSADCNSQGDKLSGCPFIPSLFPNVPPSISFADHSGKVAAMPLNVYRVLKWKLTNITPIVVRKTLLNSGFRLLRNTNDWMGTWGKHMKSPCFRTLRSYQKINHFPGTFQIGRKDRLWRNMHKCILKFGKREFGFIPRTFVLPQDLKILRQSWERYSQLEEKWIIKPPASARGTGIRVVQRWSQIPKRKPTVVQKYIARPLLINGSKFDLRLYVLVTSMHPLRIYLYPEGLARFASVKYSVDPTYLSDRYMHLTNYSINKLSTTYKANEDAKACDGHKWTLSSLWKYLSAQGINVNGLWRTLSDLVIRTMVSGESTIQVLSRLNMSSRYNCYELFGVDVLLDAELKPWLLEVNISPSLHSASPLDLHVKGPLVKALFNTALYKVPPKLTESEQQKILKDFKLEGPLCYDKRLYCTVLSRQEKEKHLEFSTVEKRSVYLYTILENLTSDDVRHLIQAEDELAHCGPLERIFPTATTHTYLQYLEAPRYYNRLFDAWEHKYSRKRAEGIALLRRLCAENVHLVVPAQATVSNGSITTLTPMGTTVAVRETLPAVQITVAPTEHDQGRPNTPAQAQTQDPAT